MAPFRVSALALLAALSAPSVLASEDRPVLTEKLMDMSLEAAILSNLVYGTSNENSGYDVGQTLAFYISSGTPDHASVVLKDGICYGVFRGTESTSLDDWFQNIDPHTDDVCVKSDPHLGQCCSARSGFVAAYEAEYQGAFEAELRACAAQRCPGSEEGCVVLTGHSQGGAIAAVASVVFHDLNPITITFGQPPAVTDNCHYLYPERHFNFIDSVNDDGELEHDVVPFSPGIGAVEYGYPIVLSPETDAVAAFPLNYSPNSLDFHLNVSPFKAHTMDSAPSAYGYIQRLQGVIAKAKATNSFPVPNMGWSDGALCSVDGECVSRRCDNGRCLAQLGSCELCNEDSDCLSNVCTRGACAGPDGKTDNGCPCYFSYQCRSGRCEFNPNQCEPRLFNGEFCNEDTDCVSGQCGWRLKCYGEGGTKPSLRYGFK